MSRNIPADTAATDIARPPFGGATPGRSSEAHCSSAFQPIAPYYDALMRDIPYERWVGYVRDLLARHGGPGVLGPGFRVLDLACGTGTVSLLLADLGCQVTGVDISAAMIREARRKSEGGSAPPEFLVQDAARLSVPSGEYDLCVSLFDSLNYVTKASDLAEAFRRVGRALKPRGALIFDMNTPLALRERMFDQEDTRRGEPVRYRWRSSFDERTSLCRIRMDFWVDVPSGPVASFTETHWQRAYGDAEIRAYLEDAGLGNVCSYEAYTFRPSTPSTDRAFYVAVRPR